jgi:hypothetical protein
MKIGLETTLIEFENALMSEGFIIGTFPYCER